MNVLTTSLFLTATLYLGGTSSKLKYHLNNLPEIKLSWYFDNNKFLSTPTVFGTPTIDETSGTINSLSTLDSPLKDSDEIVITITGN